MIKISSHMIFSHRSDMLEEDDIELCNMKVNSEQVDPEWMFVIPASRSVAAAPDKGPIWSTSSMWHSQRTLDILETTSHP